MSLNDDQVESHMRPGKLGELEPVVTFLEGADEKDEAYVQGQYFCRFGS